MALVTAALLFLFAAVPVLGADLPYPDVASDHWAYEAIARLHEAGLVEGYPDGTFGGERTFTRYEMAMVFDRILQRLDGRMDLLSGMGIDVDALAAEFGNELGLINALTAAVGNAQGAAAEAKRIAESAGDRAYHARLAAEQALNQAKKANDVAAIAVALAESGSADGEELENLRLAAQRAQRVAANAEAAAMRANAVAEMAFGLHDESQADVAEEARLAAQRAQRVAADAEAAAMKAQAMADRALTIGDAEAALKAAESAQQLADEAWHVAKESDTLAMLAFAEAELARDDAEKALKAAEAAQLAVKPKFGFEVAYLHSFGQNTDPSRVIGRLEIPVGDFKLLVPVEYNIGAGFSAGVGVKF